MRLKLLVFLLISLPSIVFSQQNVRGWYADGQVWIVWETDQQDEPLTYAIYRDPTPFNDVSKATLTGRLFKDEWTPGSIRTQSGDSTFTYVIPDGTGGNYTLRQNEGLFVETVHQTGSAYFAVVRWDETDVQPDNISAIPVNYTYSIQEPVQCHLQADTVLGPNYKSLFYTMWADGKANHRSGRSDFPIMANQYKNGMPSMFIVSAPLNLSSSKRSAVHWLHGGQGQSLSSLPNRKPWINIEPKDGFLVAHNDHIPWMVGTTYHPEGATWWFGYHQNLNPFDTMWVAPTQTDTVINYTQRRIKWINDWLIREMDVDPHRVAIQGHSMGSQGAIHLVKTFPQIFAAASPFATGFCGPVTQIGHRTFGSPEDNLPTNLINGQGETIRAYDIFDLKTPISSMRDLPVINIWCGKNDVSVMEWDAEVVEEYRILDSLGFGTQLYWDMRGHSLSDLISHWSHGTTQAEQTERDNAAYQERYRANQSFPAFYNHRIYPGNRDPGDGTVQSGDGWGTWGGYHDWDMETIVDTPVRWEVTVFLIGQSQWPVDNCPLDSLRADVAIRRPQQFLPTAESQIRWQVQSLSDGEIVQQGSGQVRQDGLVTAKGILVFRDPERVRIIFEDNGATALSESNEQSSHPSFFIYQNTPNPFNNGTLIRFSVGTKHVSHPVQLELFDVMGRRIRTLVNEIQNPGMHRIYWDGNNKDGRPAPTGIYFVRLKAGTHLLVKKMLKVD